MNKYFRQNIKLIVLFIFASLLDSCIISFSANITKLFIDKISDLTWEIICFFGLLYVADILGILACEYVVKLLSKKIYVKIVGELSCDLYSSLLREDYDTFYLHDSDFYMNMIYSDVKELYSDYFGCILGAILSGIQFLVYLINCFLVNWQMGLVVFVACEFTLFVPKLVGKKLGKKTKEVSDSSSSYLGTIKDFLAAFPLTDSRTGPHFEKVHSQSNKQYETSVFSFYKYQSWADIVGGFSFYLVNILVFVFGISFIYSGVLSLSSFIAVLSLVELIVIPSRDAVDEIIGLKSSKLIRAKLESFLLCPPGPVKKKISKIETILCDDVSYYKDGKALVDDVSFRFEKGEKYALIGKTGAGKSSLINVLLGRYKPQKGALLINGDDARSIDFSNNVGVVDQQVFIFNASAVENITLFDSYPFSLVEPYVDAISAKSLLKASLGENGSKLSGGEKKKIGLLRALEKQPNVLVTDELFAGLDEKSSQEIKTFLKTVLPKQTIYIEATHDISPDNMKRFDKVIIISDGKIIKVCKTDDCLKIKEDFESASSPKALD